MTFNNKNILITGGAGFIGSNLAIHLVQKGAKVTILDSFSPGCGGNAFNLKPIQEMVTISTGDMREIDILPKVVEGQDFIFNLVGLTSHLDSMEKPIIDLEVNAKAHLNLLETCRAYNPHALILYTSTRQIYGIPKYLPVDEAHPVDPVDVNGIHTFAGEHYHTLYAKVYGLKTVSLRLTNTYGPRQLIRHSRQGVLGWFINRALTGNTIQLFGGGQQVRDFNFVEDVVEALLLAAQTKGCIGEVFNLSGERANLESIAHHLISLTGKGSVERVPFPESLRKIDIGDYYGSSEKFFKAAHWSPSTGLKEGLRKTVEYYQEFENHYLEATS